MSARLTRDQVAALSRVITEHEADEAHIGSNEPGVLGAELHVDLFRGDDHWFHVTALIAIDSSTTEHILTPRSAA